MSTVTFAPGSQSETLTIGTVQDDINELTERFRAMLSNPIGATLGTEDSAGVTIIDNDGKIKTYRN